MFWFASHTFHLLMTVTCFLVTITGPKDCPHRHDLRSIGAKKNMFCFEFRIYKGVLFVLKIVIGFWLRFLVFD